MLWSCCGLTSDSFIEKCQLVYCHISWFTDMSVGLLSYQLVYCHVSWFIVISVGLLSCQLVY